MGMVKEFFPRTIVMDEGRVVADDLIMEILEDEKLLPRMGWRSRNTTTLILIKKCS